MLHLEIAAEALDVCALLQQKLGRRLDLLVARGSWLRENAPRDSLDAVASRRLEALLPVAHVQAFQCLDVFVDRGLQTTASVDG